MSASGASGDSVLRFNQPASPPVSGRNCTLYLHGAGQQNNVSDTNTSDGFFYAQPRTPGIYNEAFWEYDGPHTYSQTPATGESDYQTIRNYLENYLNSRNCGKTLVEGSSNGGGLAAKLYCRGEDFGQRVWAYVVDDPVMDMAVVNCSPSSNVRRVYFTHSTELKNDAAFAVNNHGGNCAYAGQGWYCHDNRTMTVAQYENYIGVDSVESCTYHGSGCNYLQTGAHMKYVFWQQEQ